jgi:hypothetical protein
MPFEEPTPEEKKDGEANKTEETKADENVVEKYKKNLETLLTLDPHDFGFRKVLSYYFS